MTKRRHYVIYIPGLGDHYDNGRSLALWFWRFFGMTTELLPMEWYGNGTYEQKLRFARDRIAIAQRAGYEVSLVGESAGASMALNVAARVSGLHKVVTVAGVNSSELFIRPQIRSRSPSFDVSARAIGASLKTVDSSRIHTIRGLVDGVVTPKHDNIPGANHHRIFTIGHLMTIVVCLTLLSPFVVSLIKRQEPKK